MTGDQSRKLKVGDRVCWDGEKGDKGIISGNDWSGVKIKWDTGITSDVKHNDMAHVRVAK